MMPDRPSVGAWGGGARVVKRIFFAEIRERIFPQGIGVSLSMKWIQKDGNGEIEGETRRTCVVHVGEVEVMLAK